MVLSAGGRLNGSTGMLKIEARSGDAVRAVVPQLARLRIDVFRDWPYLYDGTMDYEESYLGKLLDAPGHVVVCAFDGETLIGAATASPLIHQYEEFREPFVKAGLPAGEIFYFGESVLLSAYRGRGIGHAFFDERESHAQKLGYAKTTFCAVIRPADHPMRPAGYRPLDGFWRKRGYSPLAGLIGHFSWTDIGETAESSKPMQYWGRGFEAA
jgi:GNAT superfamily N-acetyltransferase